MRVKEARDIARRWVEEEGAALPGLLGAYFAGSVNWLSDDAELPATSDLDIAVVLQHPETPNTRGKFTYQGVLIEVSIFGPKDVQSAEHVLGDYHLAGAFRTPNIIVDRTGQLTQLQQAVAHGFARREWVRKRCAHAQSRILAQLDGFSASASFPDQVIGWVFPTGVTTHVLLVAGLQNPTVRNRYTAVRQLLANYGQSSFYESLLELLGCGQMTSARVEAHIAALERVFDAAKSAIKTPQPFAADISDTSRHIAIEGSRDLVARGLHREAVFWLVVTYSRCQKVLLQDAPDASKHAFDHGYHELLADLGICSFLDLQRRANAVKSFLPELWAMAEAILVANPAITD